MDRLISMTDFVLEQSEKRYEKTNDYGSTPISTGTDFDKCLKYAKFLKQPLEIWMFVPCKLADGVWVVLEEPYYYQNYISDPNDDKVIIIKDYGKCEKYQKAKERCLFEGFEYKKGKASHLIEFWIEDKFLFTYNNSTYHFLIIGNTIENSIKYNLKLTKTAQKQIGL